ncbi:MAG: hypothetical protein IJM48_05785 [Treponema sp.]|nr:hypothetical protein [Treponema sp.]
MKKFFQFPILIFRLFMILSGAAVLFSCNNFLDGGDFKEQLDKDIARAKAKECPLIVTSDPATGNFLSYGEKYCKVGYTIDLQFNVNSNDYIFKTLEAVSTKDNSISRAEYVEFTILEGDDKNGTYKIRVKLLKELTDILIRPKCILIPKIAEISPKFESAGCEQNNIIKITFNKEINKESFGDFSCITISDGNRNLYEYFNQPFFTSDGKALCYSMKSDNPVLPPNGTKERLDISIRYDFTAIKDSDGIMLDVKGSHDYRITNELKDFKTVKLNLISDNAVGSFSSSSTTECAQGYSVELKYFLNNDNYYFKGFEAFNPADNTINFSDKVSFTNITRDNENRIYTATMIITDELEELAIRSLCLLQPMAISHTPASSSDVNFANIPIEIKFNMPMEDKTTSPETSQFKYKNIYITYDGIPIDEFFEVPVFNSDKTILSIVPKGTQLTNIIKTAYINVEVTFSDKITIVSDGISLPIKQNENTSFTVRYKSDIEKIAPVKEDLFITRYKISLEGKADSEKANSISESGKFTVADFNDNDSESILRNRTSGIIYIYGKYYDQDSGVKSVAVTEQRIKDSKAVDVAESVSKAEIYTTDNASIVTDGYYTSFCIPYELKSDDGAILINVTAIDACGNSSETQVIKAIKKSKIDFSDGYTNGIPVANNVYNESNIDADKVEEYVNEYNKSLTNLSIFTGEYNGSFAAGDLNYKIYNNTNLPGEYLSINCEYTDKNGLLHKEPFVYFNNRTPDNSYTYSDEHLEGWNCSLKDIDSLEDFSFKVTVTDDMNLTYEEIFTFPPKITNIILTHVSGTTRRVDFALEKNGSISGVRMLRRNNSYPKTCDISDVSTTYKSGNLTIGEDSGFWYYRVSLRNNYLWGPLTSNEFSKDDYNNESLPLVSLTGSPYIEKTPDPEYLNIVFTVDSGVWNTYDAIFFQYSSGSESYYFDKDTNICKVPRSTNWLLSQNSSNNYTYLYGVKDTRKSSAKKVTFPDADPLEYDAVPPRFFNTKLDPVYGDNDKFEIWVSDAETGISKASIVTEIKELIPIFEDSHGYKDSEITRFKVYAPVHLIMRHSTYVNNQPYIKIELEDAAGNTNTQIISVGISETRLNGKVNTKKYDLIMQNGAQKDSVAICSDAPVYVHTVYTTRTTINVSAWTLSDWEENKGPYPSSTLNETGQEFLIFSDTDHTPQRYEIPVNKIASGCKYCVIAHFSDGSTAMSNVMEK